MAGETTQVKDLKEFIRLLQTAGELHRVTAEVDPHLEIAAIADRVSKQPGGGRALFFERVRGYRFPVAINLFGSHRRAAMALGCNSIDTLVLKLELELANVAGSSEKRLQKILSRRAYAAQLNAAATSMDCEETTENFSHLPALKSWPADAGRFLTLPQVFTYDPRTGEPNCGIYRMQIFDEKIAGVRWRSGSDAANHYAAWKSQGGKMPVAVALGGDPALIHAASTALPAGIDETRYAGFLRGSPLEMVICHGGELAVPASAEFVLEGYVVPGQERIEGPFGNHTGSYSPPAPCPVFHLTKMYRRRDAIYPCTVVGPPPMENCWLAKVNERLILALLRCDYPQMVDVNFPVETIFHGCALISVRNSGKDGREMLRDLWQSLYLRSSRMLVLVGEDVDVHDTTRVYWAAINRADPGRDILVEAGRVGIDATRGVTGGKVGPGEETTRLVNRRWEEYGFLDDASISEKRESA